MLLENFIAWFIFAAPMLMFAGIAYWALNAWMGPLPLIAGIVGAVAMGFFIGGPLLILLLIGIGFFASLIIGAGM